MGLFNRKGGNPGNTTDQNRNTEAPPPPPESPPADNPAAGADPNTEKISEHHLLPTYNHNGHLVTKGITPEGESGRSGIHPKHYLRCVWRSSCTLSKWMNILWPFVPAAIILHFVHGEHHVWTFAINYIAMVPCANLIGYAGQEFARKLPKVMGILLETTLGSVVEIVLLMVLISKDKTDALPGEGNLEYVIQAAILGSILTNLLLCLGMCFLVGGLKYKEQTFHAVISEAGSGILLVAGFALLIPSAFYSALQGATVEPAAGNAGKVYTPAQLQSDTESISHGVAVILIFAFAIYICYNAVSHDNIFKDVLEADDEQDRDREDDLRKAKLTMTECIFSIVIALTLVSLIAVFLVEEIDFIVEEKHVPDNFLGLILVPLVEKAAEHLTAIDEAYDNQINFALFHCIGPSIQTALFNAPLVVIVSWGMGKHLDLNFEIFMIVLLVLSILVVGNVLRDGASNFLEGSLLVIVYVIIAVTAWYYPNAELTTSNNHFANGGGSSGSGEAVAHLVATARRML